MSEDKIIVLLEKINKKLSILIGEKIRENKSSIKDQVSTLSKAGLDYNEIASILSISPSHAAKEISKMKKE
jgi:hypothetical protein